MAKILTKIPAHFQFRSSQRLKKISGMTVHYKDFKSVSSPLILQREFFVESVLEDFWESLEMALQSLKLKFSAKEIF